MATKRVLTSLPLRTSSLLPRCQGAVPRQFTGTIRPSRSKVIAPQFAVSQRRWHSAIPEDRKSKMYQFEDVQKIIEAPSDTTILVDVREPSEHITNSIPTSINIPVSSHPDALLLPPSEFADLFNFTKPPLNTHLVFFCKAGVRSAAAAQIAKQAGYTDVGEYRGSWLDWERRGGEGTRTGPQN